MVKIFISYRRADSRKDAGRIYDRLVEAFGKDNIFKDVDSIPLGKDFRGVLGEAVAQCDVQLAIIGRQWLNIVDEQGQRRLENPSDFVRIEIESALQRNGCLVIPVLVDNAPMPQTDDLPPQLHDLAFKNATIVRDDPDFHHDVDKVIHELQQQFGDSPGAKASPKPQVSGYDVHAAIGDFYRAMDDKQWELAREILAGIRASGQAPRVFNLDAHEQDIWWAIDVEERDQEYDVVRLMAKRPNKAHAWEALQVFWQSYPDYDPDGIAKMVRPWQEKSTRKPESTPSVSSRSQTGATAELSAAIRAIIGDPFDLCEVPAGEFLYGEKNQKLALPTFDIAKYPVTYSHYQVFIKAQDGFEDGRWWQGLGTDGDHRNQPGEQRWRMPNLPCEHVSWYDAMAFCRWLSFRLGGIYDIDRLGKWLLRLPTEFEWEKAARGTGGLIYPYGNKFDESKGNTYESGIGQTTLVTQYPQGASPYSVLDMSGNLWEWCLTDCDSPQLKASDENIHATTRRVLRGGSWFNPRDDARAVYRLIGHPGYSF